jgi:steroid 5-alpha reductase family enzyme
MDSPLDIILVNAVALGGLLFLLWLLSIFLRDASIVDPFWGLGFVVVAWLTNRLVGLDDPRAMMITVLTTIWGLRLSVYLLWRNFGQGEDYRYRAMRARHGDRFGFVSLFTVFGLQGVILWFVSLPIQMGQTVRLDSTPTLLDGLGLALWGVGFFFEAVGDYQLARFKADPANQGQVMKSGLWAFTRHPNYFGDCCVAWGIYLLALAGGAWWTFLSPALMTFLLMKVSGVAMLERTIAERRPEYADYVRTTNAFFPWPQSR